MLESASPGAAPRAFLRVGGISVARQQLTVLLGLQCERIVCLASGVTPEAIDLQHVAEQAGASFHLITNSRALVGLVTATDELIALLDGLFVSGSAVPALLDKGVAVLVQPIEPGLAAGFERIDLNHASAGAFRIPGRLVERLAELPVDCDVHSALQRIALQAGVGQRSIPVPGHDGLIWSLVRGDAEAQSLEPLWIRERTREELPPGPSRMLALFAVRRLGPALLHAGSGAAPVAIGAAAFALLSLGAGWFSLTTLGLSCCALGWVLRQAAALLARIQMIDDRQMLSSLRSETAYRWLIDGIMVALLGWAQPAEPGLAHYERYFAPVMLFAVLRLIPRILGRRWTGWLHDRAIVAVLLAAAAFTGITNEVVHAAALALAFTGIVLPRDEIPLTRP